jgi:hypothetical protein
MKKITPMSGLPLFSAALKDVVGRDVGLHPSLEKDLIQFSRLVETRGVSFFMIDMPEAGKVLDQALSKRYLNPSDLPVTFGRVVGGSRRFLKDFFVQVFDDDGVLRQDVSVSAVRNLRQVLYLFKKVKLNCSDAAVLAEVEMYLKIEDGLRLPSLTWELDTLLPRGYFVTDAEDLFLSDAEECYADLPLPVIGEEEVEPCTLMRVVQAVADNLVSRFKSPFDWRDVLPKHGPGAVADAARGSDKYLFPTWPTKLEKVFPYSYFAKSSEYAAFVESGDNQRDPSVVEFPAKLIAVPKTLKGPRMIASEPTSHQFIQLGLMRWMRDNLPSSLNQCIDFKDQEPSKVLCLEASRTGKLATVDLSAASDRLSCWVVERIFRRSPDFLEALHAARTRTLVNGTGIGDPYRVTLRKYAPMGNGTTFPVQSFVYAVVTIAAELYTLGRPVNNRTIHEVARVIRVFGDDIICSSRAVPALALVFELLQLKVNGMKTHTTGRFRESCGMDAFNGEEVTPLYLADLEFRATPDGLASWTDVMKNAWNKKLYQTYYLMESIIPVDYRKLIPKVNRDLGCLSLPSSFGGFPDDSEFPIQTRFNRKLFRWEVKALALVAKPIRRKREDDANLVQYWTDSPKPDSLWESGFVVRNRTKMMVRWVPLA